MKRQPINRENYEEYFLLYVDHELTAEEMAEVEAFAALHADLGPELKMLMDTRLEPEDLKMASIGDLYRSTGLIHEGNLEERQLLALDGELDNQSLEALEEYQQQHPEAQKNFDWLLKARLPVEEIVFPDKALLYRTEKKPAAIRSMPWLRIAAAASVILMIGFLWFYGVGDPGFRVEGSGDRVEGLASKVEGSENRVEGSGDRVEGSGDRVEGSGFTIEGNDGNPAGGIAQSNASGLQHGIAPPRNGLGEISASPDKKMAAVAGNSKKSPTQNTHTEQKESVTQNTHTEQKESVTQNTHTEQKESATLYARAEQTGPADKNVVKGSETQVTAPELQATQAVAINVKTDYAAEALAGDVEDAAEMDEDNRQRKGLRGIIRKANRFYNKVTNPDLDRQMVKVASLEVGLPR